MSSNTNLARLPIATMKGVLVTIAAGLRGETTDVLQLRVDEVCLRFIHMIRSAHPLLDLTLSVGAPIALLGVGIWKHVMIVLKISNGLQQLHASFLCHLTVPGEDRLNKPISAYLANHGIGRDSRTISVASPDTFDQREDQDGTSLRYLPTPTTDAWFTFNGNWLKFTKAEKPIKDFLDHLQEDARAKLHTMIEIFRCVPGQKSKSIPRPARKLDSVSMDAAKKDKMIADMTAYLAAESWYADRGIPWRRGYLLYGPPGTGKTSIATAIAGNFRIPLVIVSLSQPGMDDSTLQYAFDHLPRRCVVLLEDLDSAGIGRERMAQPQTHPQPQPQPKRKWKHPFPDPFAGDSDSDYDGTPRQSKPLSPANITLSGLLNAIDGVSAHEGRILICTTNSPDSLDPALLRPGRIDMKILFGNATTDVTESLFAHIFADTTGERTKHDVAQMAKKFAALVPEDRLTPAEIQNFLLQHRNHPAKVIDGAEAWVTGLLAAKSQKGNVASFKGQI